MRRVGMLFGIAADDPTARAEYAAFLQGLQQLGWIEGRNVHIDPRWAGGNAAALRNTRRVSRTRLTSSCLSAPPDGAIARGIPYRADCICHHP